MLDGLANPEAASNEVAVRFRSLRQAVCAFDFQQLAHCDAQKLSSKLMQARLFSSDKTQRFTRIESIYAEFLWLFCQQHLHFIALFMIPYS